MTHVEKLEVFADLATSQAFEEEYRYWDASDPDNVNEAYDYLNNELGFLSGRDKDDLIIVWNQVRKDGRDTRLLFSAIKVLQGKYKIDKR